MINKDGIILDQQKKIEEINLDEVKYFREHFLDSYYLTLDEHTK